MRKSIYWDNRTVYPQNMARGLIWEVEGLYYLHDLCNGHRILLNVCSENKAAFFAYAENKVSLGVAQFIQMFVKN